MRDEIREQVEHLRLERADLAPAAKLATRDVEHEAVESEPVHRL